MSPCVHPHCGGQEPTTLSRTPPTAFPRPPPWLSWRSPRPAAGAGPHLSGLGAGAEGEHLPKPEWRWPSSPGGLGLSCWSDGHTRESPPWPRPLSAPVAAPTPRPIHSALTCVGSPPAPTPALCLCSRAFSVLLEPQPSSDMAALRGVGSSPTSWLKRITDVCVTDGPRAGTTPSLPQVPWIPGKIQRPGGSVPHMCPWGGRVSTQDCPREQQHPASLPGTQHRAGQWVGHVGTDGPVCLGSTVAHAGTSRFPEWSPRAGRSGLSAR